MKILLVHNNYGKYSGEEAVVDKMASMFREHGHEVCFYRLTTERSRESLSGKIKGFLCGIYSPSGVKGLREILEREKPDVVNVHNLYPFISPAALFECKKTKVPVVMTVHNFRLICPTGLFMRNVRFVYKREMSGVVSDITVNIPISNLWDIRYEMYTLAGQEHIRTM